MKINTDQKLFEQAALLAYNAHIIEGTFNRERCAKAAWEDAALFMEARREYEINRRVEIIKKYQTAEALRKIIEMDGNQGQIIDSMLSRFKEYAEPLKAYAESGNKHNETFGMIAIMRYYKQQHRTNDT